MFVKMRWLAVFILFYLTSCSRSEPPPYVALTHLHANERPTVALLPMKDGAETPYSSMAATALTQSIEERLQLKSPYHLTDDRGHFVVMTKLVQHSELPIKPVELAMSIHLEILDVRSDPPTVILQEVISARTLLGDALCNLPFPSRNDEQFRITPLGLSHAKLSREIATRIEDYIELARKG